MTKVRRTAYAFFTLEDDYVLDAVALLRGCMPEPAPEARIVATAALTGEAQPIAREDWETLLSIPTDRWVEGGAFDEEVTRRLLDRALLISDSDEDPLRKWRDRDEALTANAWNHYAALYHFATQWSGIEIRDGIDGDAELAARTTAAIGDLVAEHGPAPAALAHVDSSEKVRLPGRVRNEPFFLTLTSRKTTRAFDVARPMSIEDFDTVLRYVFGCHGYSSTVEGVVCIKRTSASGGGLHPLTVYPVVSNVEGVASGIYHYNAGDHSLALVESLSRHRAGELAASFMCGQTYFARAHVSFVLTARFYRNHWKYRRHPRAYAGILMDAAHLSQTLYLVGAELGLGAYVTLGINGRDIEERLCLDGIGEGAVAVCGCGPRAAVPSPLESEFTVEPPASVA